MDYYYYRMGKTNNIIIDPKSTRCTLSFRFVLWPQTVSKDVDLFVYVDKDVSVKYVVMQYYFYLCVSLTSLLIIIINAILHHSFARTLSLSALYHSLSFILLNQLNRVLQLNNNNSNNNINVLRGCL